MFFLLEQQNNTLPKIDPRDELHYNYIILSMISKKYTTYLSDILGSASSIHSYEYTNSMTAYFKDKKKDINYELLRNLDIDKEINNNYQLLNKLFKGWKKGKYSYECFRSVILSMITIHSDAYITKLCEVAEQHNSYELAGTIMIVKKSESQGIKEEIKNCFKNKYFDCIEPLYGGKYKGQFYTIEEKLCNLQYELSLIFGEDNEIVKSCDAVIKDICSRGQKMIDQISDAIKNHTQWWYFDNNKLLHINV